MKLIKKLNKWGIYQNSPKEVLEYDFQYSVIHPENMGIGLLTPHDSDIECCTLEQAISWIKNYY